MNVNDAMDAKKANDRVRFLYQVRNLLPANNDNVEEIVTTGDIAKKLNKEPEEIADALSHLRSMKLVQSNQYALGNTRFTVWNKSGRL